MRNILKRDNDSDSETDSDDIVIKGDDDDDDDDEDEDDSFLGAMHLNRDIPVPPNSPVLDPEDPDNISVISNEETDEAKLPTEEEEDPLEATDASGVAEKHKRKDLLVEEFDTQTLCEQKPSFEDTSDSLETGSPKQRVMKSKKGEASAFLSTSTHSLVYNELKKLFSKSQPFYDCKPGTSVQKEPGREEEGKGNVGETSVTGQPNPPEDLNQSQSGSGVTQESMDNIVEDQNTLPPEEGAACKRYECA
ncbi:double-strand-break repair protein rad21-like protein 1 isoform 1-T3 [Thomomys bottae]